MARRLLIRSDTTETSASDADFQTSAALNHALRAEILHYTRLGMRLAGRHHQQNRGDANEDVITIYMPHEDVLSDYSAGRSFSAAAVEGEQACTSCSTEGSPAALNITKIAEEVSDL